MRIISNRAESGPQCVTETLHIKQIFGLVGLFLKKAKAFSEKQQDLVSVDVFLKTRSFDRLREKSNLRTNIEGHLLYHHTGLERTLAYYYYHLAISKSCIETTQDLI